MPRGRPQKYPWEKWFSAYRTTLTWGKDFTLDPKVMMQSIRTRAVKEKLKVSITHKLPGQLLLKVWKNSPHEQARLYD